MDPGAFVAASSSCKDVDLKKIPINALSPRTRSTLSDGLNKEKFFLSECGDQRDWRGIIKNFGYPNFRPSFEMNAMEEVLKFLTSKCINDFTLGRFQEILERIDRWDVFDDTINYFYEDARNYSSQPFEILRSNKNGRNSAEHVTENEQSGNEPRVQTYGNEAE